MPAGKFLTTTELNAIREHFPQGGAKACQAHMPTRTLQAIRQLAWVNGIRRDQKALFELRCQIVPKMNNAKGIR